MGVKWAAANARRDGQEGVGSLCPSVLNYIVPPQVDRAAGPGDGRGVVGEDLLRAGKEEGGGGERGVSRGAVLAWRG